MTHAFRHHLASHAILLALLLGWSGVTQAIDSELIDEISLSSADDPPGSTERSPHQQRVHIRFTQPVQIRSSRQNADHTQWLVQLVPTLLVQSTQTSASSTGQRSPSLTTELFDEQRFRFHGTSDAPLSRVQLQALNSGSEQELELQFTTPVRLELQPDKDFRGLTIRVNALSTAKSPSIPTPTPPGDQAQHQRWDLWGSWSQYYRHDMRKVDDTKPEKTRSALSSTLNSSLTYRGDDHHTRLRLSGSHNQDFLDQEPDTNRPANQRRYRLSNVYLEHQHDHVFGADTGGSIKAGRFSSQSDGTLGRYDGIKIGVDLSDRISIGLVTGYPVRHTTDSFPETLDGTRQLNGVSLDMALWQNGPELVLYGIEQTTGDLIDRRAIGSEFRWYQPRFNLLAALDYDVHFQTINIALLQANWTLPDRTVLSSSYDVRRSPTLTTQNALIGQTNREGFPVPELDKLSIRYTDNDIYDLARDRSALVHTLTFSATHPVGDRLNWGSDLALSKINAQPASGDVAAVAASGVQHFLNTRLTGTGLLGKTDRSTLGIRHSGTDERQAFGGYLSNQMSFNTRWRLFTRLQLERSDWHDDEQQQQRGLASLKADYRWQDSTLEAELSTEYVETQADAQTATEDATDESNRDEETLTWFLNLGYRIDF